MDHLIFLGHRRIAMIAAVDPDQPGWPAISGRSQAYYSALRDAGIAADARPHRHRGLGRLQGADAMAKLLGLREPPTAVYAHSDEVALGAIRTMRRAGLRVPEDISVIGIDDHPLAELTDLSTVGQPVYEQGVLAGQMVLGCCGARTSSRQSPCRPSSSSAGAPPHPGAEPAPWFTRPEDSKRRSHGPGKRRGC